MESLKEAHLEEALEIFKKRHFKNTRDSTKLSFSRIFIFEDKQKSAKTSKFLSLENI